MCVASMLVLRMLHILLTRYCSSLIDLGLQMSMVPTRPELMSMVGSTADWYMVVVHGGAPAGCGAAGGTK